jgi:hypothetical protein
MSNATLKQKLMEAGVKNLREFGYPSVSKANITSERVFAMFFRSMLEENRGQGADAEIDELIAEIDRNLEKTA